MPPKAPKQNWTLPDHNSKKSHKVAYINARIIDPESGFDKKGALLTEGEKIADFGPALFKNGVPKGIEVVDCEGHVLCPGLVDIQVHFREPGQEHKETINTGSKSAAAGGITMVVCQPNTKPVLDNVPIVEFIKNRARETSYVNIRAYGAISKDMKGETITEMGLMRESGVVVGFTDDGLPVMNSLLMRRALEFSKMLDVPIAQHAEDLNLSNKGCINEGKISTKLGVPGIPNASEAVCVDRDIHLVALTGGVYHLLHASTHEAVESIRRAKKMGLNVTAEAAPHHFTLTDEAVLDYKTFAKMNPPLRAEKDRLAIIEGLKDGTIDAIATDHAPHDQESKRVPLTSAAFGIVGVETMLPLSLALYQNKTLSLRDVLGKMTWRAADIIREKRGRIKKGAIADLTLIDLGMEWVVENDKLSSKSKNSPFDGRKVKGRAIRTIVSGQTVYTLG
ncbi:MAG: dihydroorotase [Proteobacteria bacterium]|nr:dihydroorotase [Pseudomonadota bacterium]